MAKFFIDDSELEGKPVEPTKLKLFQEGEEVLRAKGNNPFFVAVYFDNPLPIRAIQEAFAATFPDMYFELTATEKLHMTLFYAENVSNLQAAVLIASLGQPGKIPVEFYELGTFSSAKDAPVVIHAKMNEYISNPQRKLYLTAKALGLETSPFSVPEEFRPHISIAYEFEDGSRIPRIQLFSGVVGTKIVFSRADYEIVHEIALEDKPSAGVMNTAQYLRRLVLGRKDAN